MQRGAPGGLGGPREKERKSVVNPFGAARALDEQVVKVKRPVKARVVPGVCVRVEARRAREPLKPRLGCGVDHAAHRVAQLGDDAQAAKMDEFARRIFEPQVDQGRTETNGPRRQLPAGLEERESLRIDGELLELTRVNHGASRQEKKVRAYSLAWEQTG